MKTFLIHITDTHYAAPGQVLGVQGASHPKLTAQAVLAARNAVWSQKGASAADPTLWVELKKTLEHLAMKLGALGFGQDYAAIHTGDISQAGQLQSMGSAISALKQSARVALPAIVGNHDLWPGEFPLFAPSLTAHQHFHVRHVFGLPRTYPRGPLALPNNFELLLLNTTVADSLLNTTALGKMEADPGVGVTIIDPLTLPSTSRLRIVAQHHPVIDVGVGLGRQAQTLFGVQLGMGLLEAPDTQQCLANAGVALVLCGHEHRATADLSQDRRILQLAAGCPTLAKGHGNPEEPQFSVYLLEDQGPDLYLHRFVCRLFPEQWSEMPSFVHDGKVWNHTQVRDTKTLGQLRGKPLAPFSQSP